MKVIAKLYPESTVHVSGKFYHFSNGVADIPEHDALSLCARYPDKYMPDSASLPAGGYLPFNPTSWTKNRKIIWDGPIGYDNGYGKASMMLIEGLSYHSDIYVVQGAWAANTKKHKGDVLSGILEKKTDKVDSFYIKFFPASDFHTRVAERYVGYTMLEASRIPYSWVQNINRNCERVIVPSSHQKEAFINSGVVRDVEYIPLGLKSELFPLIERKKEDNLYYFGTMGTLTYRKGTDLLIKAFIHGLPKDKYPDARLYIKTLPLGGIGSMWFMSKEDMERDGRIDFCLDSFNPQELIEEFFAKIDCFVFPTRGEGFGLPPLEAILTGLPTICTTYSGTGDFINDETGFPIGYKMVDVPNGKFGGYPEPLRAEGQQWADPSLDELIEHMRYCYNNREKASEKAKKASEILRDKYDMKNVAKQVVDYLDKKF